MEEVELVSTQGGKAAEAIGKNCQATPLATSKGNILSQLQELPSNVSSARVFKLPPGVIFVNPSTGQLVSGAAPPPLILKNAKKKCSTEATAGAQDKNTKEIVSTATAKKTQPVFQIVERMVLPSSAELTVNKQKLSEVNSTAATSNLTVKPRIITLPRPNNSTLTSNKPRIIALPRPSSDDKPRIITLPRPSSLTANPSRVVLPRPLSVGIKGKQILPEIHIGNEPPPLVKIEPRSPLTATNNVSEPEPIAKPKPWSRAPRPLFRSKEPVVMYSGCKPEDLEKERKKRTREKDKRPESLPCPEKLEVCISTFDP